MFLRAPDVLPHGLRADAGDKLHAGQVLRSLLGLPRGDLPAGDDLDAAGDAATLHDLSDRLHQPVRPDGALRQGVRLRRDGLRLCDWGVRLFPDGGGAGWQPALHRVRL